jgi:predicted DNA-binding transcriptional regulator AlpA
VTAAELIAEIAELDPADISAVAMALAGRMAQVAQRLAPTAASEKDLLDVREAAQMLGISPSWLQHRTKLPFRRKIGAKVKFSRRGITEWSKRDHGAA